MLPRGSWPLTFLAAASLVQAATVTLNWTATWVTANPDGRYTRPVIGINGQWPCPIVEASVGDYIVLNLTNNLGNETTGLHFHGLNQVNTPEMDGPSGVTQCPVPPGSSITYKFYLDAPGTYWYHSHDMGQYPDGLRGPLIIHDPNDPYTGKYDEELVLSVSDWYHNQSISLVRGMLNSSNVLFQPPLPDNILVNEGQGANINFTSGRTYRLRIVSFAALGSAMIHFGSHDMQVIMNDGTYVKQTKATQLRVSPAQRYDVLITATSQDKGNNYPYLVALDINRDYTNLTGLLWPHNYTGYLVGDTTKKLPGNDSVSVWKPVDDSTFLPYNNATLLGPAAKSFVLNFTFCMFNNEPRACFNNQPNIPQQVPALYTAATTNDSNDNPAIYGNINPIVVNYGDIVQIVVNNGDLANHPFHLHGHQFQVVERPPSNAGPWPGSTANFASTPPMRDTVGVNPKSYAVLRYTANNPGIMLFHCHVEWHVEMGLTATIIEAPEKLRGLTFPDDHINNCKLQGIPYQGNAAGNTANYTDTSGFNTAFPSTYEGALYLPAVSQKMRRTRRAW